MARLDSLSLDIKDIRRRLSNLERINQAKVLQFGSIIIDGINDELIITTDTGSLQLDGAVGNIVALTTSDLRANFITMQKMISGTPTNVAKIDFRSRDLSGTLENVIETLSYESSQSTRITYNSLAVYSSAGVRQTFLEINKSVVAGVLQSYGMNFGINGVPSSFYVTIDDSSGNGYMNMPSRASDPSASYGRMYYNTALNKVRIYDGTSGWKSL